MGWFHFHKVPRIVKFTEAESRIEVTGGWGQGRQTELLFTGSEVSVWDDILKSSRNRWWQWFHITLRMELLSLKCALKMVRTFHIFNLSLKE